MQISKFMLGVGALILGITGFYIVRANNKIGTIVTLYFITAGGVTCKQITLTNAFITSTGPGGSIIVTINGSSPVFYVDNACTSSLSGGHHIFLKS